MTSRLRILISNDDGYRADGIVALHDALQTFADVEVVAPEHNNSAKSNALTLHSPLYVHQAGNGFRYVNGTPADCVHIALTGLLGYRPDLVVSGINNGANMGDDTLYSGTVGAAMEGYLFGIPSIAFSQTEKGWAHLDAAAERARDLVLQMHGRLKDRQEQAQHDHQHERRSAQIERGVEAPIDEADEMFVHGQPDRRKFCRSFVHPSTAMNKSSLTGVEMMVGDMDCIDIDTRMTPTARSTTTKGR